MTKATLQLTTKIRFGSIFSTVIILHNRVRKNKTKLYGVKKYPLSENTMLIDIVIFKYLTFESSCTSPFVFLNNSPLMSSLFAKQLWWIEMNDNIFNWGLYIETKSE